MCLRRNKKQHQDITSRPAGYLLSKAGLLVMFACLLLAAWFNQVVIVVTLGLLLSAAGVSRLWSGLSMAGVSCQRSLSETRTFPGDTVELSLRLVNRKLLPLPWVLVEDEIPAVFDESGSMPEGDRPGTVLLSSRAALLWYTGINWKKKLHCSKRGYYRFGPLKITTGDFFGFYPRTRTLPALENVVVYPKIIPLESLGIDSLQPVGEMTAERRIFEDPVRLVGVRDYTPHDSRRRIHWKASARHQNLQVKVFEPTTSLKVALFLAVDSFKPDLAQHREDFELGVSVAASVASHLIERHSGVGLFVNSCQVDSEQPVAIFPGSSTEHLVAMLEALARVTRRVSVPFEQFLQAESSRLPWGTTRVFILSRSHSRLTELLLSLQQEGQKIRIIPVGNSEDDPAQNDIQERDNQESRTMAFTGGTS